jgi:hypothetical protein
MDIDADKLYFNNLKYILSCWQFKQKYNIDISTICETLFKPLTNKWFDTIRNIHHASALDSEFPIGKERISFKFLNNFTIIDLNNFSRQMGKTNFCQHLCKQIKNSLYVSSQTYFGSNILLAKKKKISVMNYKRFFRHPGGCKYELICFDDFGVGLVQDEIENSSKPVFLEKCKSLLKHDGILVFVNSK